MGEFDPPPPPASESGSAAQLQLAPKHESAIPWWVTSPPTIETNGRYVDENNIFNDVIEITDGTQTDRVFAKVFDPDGKVIKRGIVESQRRWSEGAPHQQALRVQYARAYPDDPPAILYSAATHDENGFPAIIQEVAPAEFVSTTLSDRSLPLDQRKNVFFSAVKQYAQYLLTVYDYGLELGKTTGNYFGFQDQKGRDLRWEHSTNRLVVLDVQSMGPYRQDEFELRFAQSDPTRYITPSQADFKQLLTEKEMATLTKIEEQRTIKKRNARENLQLYRNFAMHQLSDGDPRLALSAKEAFNIELNIWKDKLGTKLRVIAEGLEYAQYSLSLNLIADQLNDNPTPEVAERLRLFQALAETFNYTITDKSISFDERHSLPQTEFPHAVQGLTKYLAGAWDLERTPEEIAMKQASETSLRRYLQMKDAHPKIKQLILEKFPQLTDSTK